MSRRKCFGRCLGGLLLAGGMILLFSQCLLIPERGFVGERVGNTRPYCRITGGVLIDTANPDSAADALARVHFYWFGSDNDGLIRWFEWAIDDTVSEGAWHQTTAYDEIIPFHAATRVAGSNSFSGWHTFFVRSVDNEFTRSRPDRRFFNAHTIAPESEIILPDDHQNQYAQWARTLKFTWKGEDSDGSRADGLPAAFEYKWVEWRQGIPTNDIPTMRAYFDTTANEFLRDSLKVEDFPNREYYRQALREWVRVPGTTTEVWLENMAVTAYKYGFVVRAIDEAGAVEPDLGWDNWAVFKATDKNILVYVTEPAFGIHTFSTSEMTAATTWELSIAPEQRFRFEWEGDATAAGTQPGPSNYGLDMLNPLTEDERSLDGINGWIGWGMRRRMDRPFYFPRSDEGQTHHFYLKMRDVSGFEGTETRCHISLRVARFSFHKKFCLVDDLWNRASGGYPYSCSASAPTPDDVTMDAWDRDVYEAMNEYLTGDDRPGTYSIYREGDTETTPSFVDAILDTLGQYQTLIWSAGAPDQSGLRLYSFFRTNALARYISAGGNLLLVVENGPVEVITRDVSWGVEEPVCPSTSRAANQAFDRYSFLYQQLHLRFRHGGQERGGCIEKPSWLIQADIPFFLPKTMVAARAERQIYPDLPLDWEAWGCRDRGMWRFEALWPDNSDPEELPWYEIQEGLEVLYRTRTFEKGAKFDNLPVAWRTFGTAEDRALGINPGRIVCFAFHPYFCERSAVKACMTLALQWLVTGSEF